MIACLWERRKSRSHAASVVDAAKEKGRPFWSAFPFSGRWLRRPLATHAAPTKRRPVHQNFALNSTPTVRGSLMKPVRLLKSMPPTMRRLVGDVAAEQRDLVVAVAPRRSRCAGRLPGSTCRVNSMRVVQEEVHFAAVGPVGVHVQLGCRRPSRRCSARSGCAPTSVPAAASIAIDQRQARRHRADR